MNKSEICKTVIIKATQLLNEALKKAGVPDSHGMGHCTTVLSHMNKALLVENS